MKKLTLMMMLFISVMGCQKKSDNGEVSSTPVANRVVGNGTSLSQMKFLDNVWGEVILLDGQSQANFQEQVKGLVSANMDPMYLGTVSGTSGANTGIRLSGQIYIEDCTQSRTRIVGNRSKMMMVVFDSLAGTKDQGGNVLPEYAVTFASASEGEIDGDNMSVTFKDNMGEISIDGKFRPDFFIGTVSYKNSVATDGAQPASGKLGALVIRTEGFVTCLK